MIILKLTIRLLQKIIWQHINQLYQTNKLIIHYNIYQNSLQVKLSLVSQLLLASGKYNAKKPYSSLQLYGNHCYLAPLIYRLNSL